MADTNPRLTAKHYFALTAPFGLGICIAAAAGPWDRGALSGVQHTAALAAIGAASATTGGLLGFLFGLPKRRDPRAEGSELYYQGNTNLEDVSDWLTKIIVGVSLVELRGIASGAWRLAELVAASMIIDLSVGIVCTVGVYSWVNGFCVTYIFTRWYLPDVFLAPERMQGRSSHFSLEKMNRRPYLANITDQDPDSSPVGKTMVPPLSANTVVPTSQVAAEHPQARPNHSIANPSSSPSPP